MTCGGGGRCRHTSGPPLQILPAVGWFFPKPPGGSGAWYCPCPKPSAPCRHHETGRAGRCAPAAVTWAGSAPARCRSPASSRVTAQLVRSHSCQPVASQPAPPLAPAPETAPGAAAPHVQLPASPSLVPVVAPLAGGSATSNRFSGKAASSEPCGPRGRGGRGPRGERLLPWALEAGGRGAAARVRRPEPRDRAGRMERTWAR